MKTLIAASFFFLAAFTAPIHWQKDLSTAKQAATEQHKFILLNFSGSDWCIPCIRMHREIFNSEAFSSYSDQKLVLLNADFPRLKKNQLSKDQEKKNDQLADQYNPTGKFPFTVLMNADGKVIRTWDGLPTNGTEGFINEVENAINSSK